MINNINICTNEKFLNKNNILDAKKRIEKEQQKNYINYQHANERIDINAIKNISQKINDYDIIIKSLQLLLEREGFDDGSWTTCTDDRMG